MKILFAIFLFAFFVCVVMLCVCFRGGNSKIYCFLFNHDEWKNWETIIKNFDAVTFEGHHTWKSAPWAECYAFNIQTLDGCRLNYWVKSNQVSAHDYPNLDDCCSSFDKHHQKVVKALLREKFDFMREVISQ